MARREAGRRPQCGHERSACCKAGVAGVAAGGIVSERDPTGLSLMARDMH